MQEENLVCAYCTGSLDEGDVHRCGKCKGMLHEVCWHENGGHCATMGCPNSGAVVRGKKNELITALKNDLTELDKVRIELEIRQHWMKNGAMAVLRFGGVVLDNVLHVIMMFIVGILPFRTAQELLCVQDAKTAEEMGSVLEIVVLIGGMLFFSPCSVPGILCMVAAILSLFFVEITNRPLILPFLLGGVYGVFYYAPKALITGIAEVIKDQYEAYIREQVDEEAEKKLIEEHCSKQLELRNTLRELDEVSTEYEQKLRNHEHDICSDHMEKLRMKIHSALGKMNVKSPKAQNQIPSNTRYE